MIRRAAAAVLCLALVLCLSGFSPAPKRYQAEFFGLFDTVTTLVGYAPDRASFTALAQKTQDLLREYHELYDIFNTYHGVKPQNRKRHAARPGAGRPAHH